MESDLRCDRYIAVDWGTTNRRAYLMNVGGAVLDQMDHGPGAASLSRSDYVGEIASIRARLGNHQIVAAGMIGSNRGLIEVPYADAPATLDKITRAVVHVLDDVFVVPGLALKEGSRPDVMRGEETQVLGAIAAGLAPPTALFCQPGTHNKWISVDERAIVDFATAMTGELFALMRHGGVLSGMLDGEVSDDTAFRNGLDRGHGARDLTVALFEVRASVLLGRVDVANAAAFASGILIGADVGARGDISGQEVFLLASGSLADLYSAAIREFGGSTVVIDSVRAFTSGIHYIREQLQ